MTPALKAMVEAMVAEIRRQNALDNTVSDPPPAATVVFVNGVVDLEKVTRAGLEAIYWPNEAMSTSGKHTLKGAADDCERTQAEMVWRSMLAEIKDSQ